MSDKKTEQSSTIQTVRVRSGPVGRWRRWHHKSRVLLMLLGAVSIVVYLLRAGLAQQYAGLGAALCLISVGGFLVWHLIHLFAEEDVIEEREINIERPDQEKKQTMPPPESGEI